MCDEDASTEGYLIPLGQSCYAFESAREFKNNGKSTSVQGVRTKHSCHH